MRPRGLLIALATAALALGVAACGSDDSDTKASSSTGSDTLTIYSSMPLRGTNGEAERAASIVNGEKLALAEAGGKAGDYTVKFQSLDSQRKPGTDEPGDVGDNARRAVADRSTIAYLGDLDDRSSAISIPILNQADILQVSPSNTYVGLTRTEIGRAHV